jgi:precorrin-6x reductase
MFRAAGASILVTKESGAAGGFTEKLAAARNCGMTTAVLARPKDTDGLTAAEWLRRIEEGTI